MIFITAVATLALIFIPKIIFNRKKDQETNQVNAGVNSNVSIIKKRAGIVSKSDRMLNFIDASLNEDAADPVIRNRTGKLRTSEKSNKERKSISRLSTLKIDNRSQPPEFYDELGLGLDDRVRRRKSISSFPPSIGDTTESEFKAKNMDVAVGVCDDLGEDKSLQYGVSVSKPTLNPGSNSNSLNGNYIACPSVENIIEEGEEREEEDNMSLESFCG